MIFRVFGQYFFNLDFTVPMILSYVFVVPVIVILTLPIYKLKKIQVQGERLKAAICIAIPGMLIDSIVLVYFDRLFINLSPDTDRYFSSWLMWAYSLILFSGFIPKKNRETTL